MSINWGETLPGLARLYEKAARLVVIVLNRDNVDEATVKRLHGIIEMGADTMDQLYERLRDDDDLHPRVHRAIGAIQLAWDDLSGEVANRLREIRGLDPIPRNSRFKLIHRTSGAATRAGF